MRKPLLVPLRIFGTSEELLFLAKDVAEWLEHSNVAMMLATVDAAEKVKIEFSTINKAYSREKNLVSEAWFLTEDGLYEVLMLSRKPLAKEFKKQVKEILKTIRKTGGFVADNKEPEN